MADGRIALMPGQTWTITGGQLAGSGVIASNLTNDGTVSLGSGAAPGTSRIRGDYTQTASGISLPFQPKQGSTMVNCG